MKSLSPVSRNHEASFIIVEGDDLNFADSQVEARRMSNMRTDELVPLRELVDDLPSPHDGRPYNPSTLTRWSLYGLRGTKLESFKLGGRRYSSREALRRFLAACAGE